MIRGHGCLDRSENVPDALIPHKTFTGNRPSSSIMLPDLGPYTTGQILALYENITAAMVHIYYFRLDAHPHNFVTGTKSIKTCLIHLARSWPCTSA